GSSITADESSNATAVICRGGENGCKWPSGFCNASSTGATPYGAGATTIISGERPPAQYPATAVATMRAAARTISTARSRGEVLGSALLLPATTQRSIYVDD